MMMKHFHWMLAAILTISSTITATAQTKQGEWFSSSSIGAGLSTFAGDIEDAKSRFGLVINTEIGYNVTDWFAPSIGLTNAYQGVGYTVIDKNLYMDVLSVPLLMNFSAGPVTLKAGIQPDFILSARMNGISYTNQLKTMSLSAPLALNWNFLTDDDGDLWFFELRYHLGLTKMNKDIMFTNGWRTPGSIRNSIIMLTIGYKCDL
jgi:hypothetical protein